MYCFFVIKNEFGDLKSTIFDVDEDKFDDMCKGAQSFGLGSWSMDTDDGHMIIPADLCKRSILLINKYIP